MKGNIFEIEEFSVYDGPGIRTAVFFKGCPLRCKWCHNPEGLSFVPQLVKSPNGCLHCGACTAVCEHKGNCVLCGKCLSVCPRNLIRIVGQTWEAADLAAELWKNSGLLKAAGGGITLTGGEVLAQPEFLCELLDCLQGMHRAVETSAYASGEIFQRVIDRTELVMMDLKAMDPQVHRAYIGVDNAPILANLELLKKSGGPFIIRIPLMPTVNDTEENFRQVAKALAGAENLVRVDIMAYNPMAGSKYAMLCKTYDPGFDDTRKANHPFHVLAEHGIPFMLL